MFQKAMEGQLPLISILFAYLKSIYKIVQGWWKLDTKTDIKTD